jgi:hypothetical protein
MNNLSVLVLASAILFLGDVDQLHSQNNPNGQPPVAQKAPDPLAPDYAVAPPQKWEKKFSDFQFKVTARPVNPAKNIVLD